MSVAADARPGDEVSGGGALDGAARDRRRIVVVGPCASGKSTLVEGLRRLGYRAMVSGQEHSEIPTLWRHAEPDIVVALDVDLPSLRRRRGEEWPEWLYRLQRRRLREAIAAADLLVDTSALDRDPVLGRVTDWLQRRPPPRTAPAAANGMSGLAAEPPGPLWEVDPAGKRRTV